MSGLAPAILGAVVIGAVSTLGDFIWATWIPEHRPIFGLSHGTLLFLCIGLYLGALVSKPLLGGGAGALIGFLAAGGFYVLVPILGARGMIVPMLAMWIAFWVAFSVLNTVILRGNRSLGHAFARGAIAAVSSGIGFYVISGIWMPFDPSGIDFIFHFGAWIVAYLPGFVALLVTTGRAS